MKKKIEKKLKIKQIKQNKIKFIIDLNISDIHVSLDNSGSTILSMTTRQYGILSSEKKGNYKPVINIMPADDDMK